MRDATRAPHNKKVSVQTIDPHGNFLELFYFSFNESGAGAARTAATAVCVATRDAFKLIV